MRTPLVLARLAFLTPLVLALTSIPTTAKGAAHARLEADLGPMIPTAAANAGERFDVGVGGELRALLRIDAIDLGVFGAYGGARWHPATQQLGTPGWVGIWTLGFAWDARLVDTRRVAWVVGLGFGAGRVDAKSACSSDHASLAFMAGTGVDVHLGPHTDLTTRVRYASLLGTSTCVDAAAGSDAATETHSPSIAYARVSVGIGQEF